MQEVLALCGGVVGVWNPKSKAFTAFTTYITHPPFYLHNACEHAEHKHTMADVQKNEWVVLDGYVYDIKPFLHRHPGGRNI